MERRTIPRAALAFAVSAVVACGFGMVDSLPVDPPMPCVGECPDGTVCRGGSCVEPNGSCEGVFCPAGEYCSGGTCTAGDPCDGVTCPDPGDVCQAGRCVAGGDDADGDGVSAREDCDDWNPDVHPGAAEVCNGRDDDCDGLVDEDNDRDRDGFTSCGTGSARTTDCDDGDPEVYPGAPERCNGVDDDCDGETDEDVEDRPCTTDCGSGMERCEGGEWYCSAPAACECSPAGAEDEEVCGRCGTRSRTCEDDMTWSDWSPCVGDHDCPVVCGDSVCEGGETCTSCEADCGRCPAGCPATDHMGSGENGDPCSDPPETWRCVWSDRWDDWISQVCRDGAWVTFHINPRDCEACCDDYSIACRAP